MARNKRNQTLSIIKNQQVFMKVFYRLNKNSQIEFVIKIDFNCIGMSINYLINIREPSCEKVQTFIF